MSTGTGAGSWGSYCRGQGIGEGAAGSLAGVTGPSPWLAQPPWGPWSWTLLGGGLRNLPRNSSIWPELWEMHNRLWDGLVCGLLGHSGWTPGETSRAPGQHLPPPATWSTSVVDMLVADVRCWQAGPILGAGGGGGGAGLTRHPAALCGLSPSLLNTHVLPSPLTPLAGSPMTSPAPLCVFRHSGTSDSVRPHGLQPTRLLCL